MLRVIRSYKILSRVMNMTGVRNTRNLYYVNHMRNLYSASASELVNKQEYVPVSDNFVAIEDGMRRGNISAPELELVMKSFEMKAHLTNSQVLLLLNCCGSLAAIEKPEVRMKYAESIWNKAKIQGIKLDVSHFNALLKVRIENEYSVSQQEFLNEMALNNVTPNRVTYQYLLLSCCEKGDIKRAITILEDMKKNLMHLNENVFNSLVLGHCIANDTEGTKNILKLMEEKNIPIDSATYTMRLRGLAVAGDMEEFKNVLEECVTNRIPFKNKQLLDVMYYLTINGYMEQAKNMIPLLKNVRLSEIENLIYRLLHKMEIQRCFEIVKFIKFETVDSLAIERLILRYLALNLSPERLKELCQGQLREEGFTGNPWTTMLYYTLYNQLFDKSLIVLKEMHKSGQTIKESYFWPIVADAAKKNDMQEILSTIHVMKTDFGVYLSKDFLFRILFNNLSMNPNKETVLLDGIVKIGVSRNFVTEAYISSCIAKGDVERLLGINKLHISAKNRHVLAKNAAAKVKDFKDIVRIMSLIRKLIVSEASEYNENQEILGQTESSTSEHSENFNNIARDIISVFVDEINSVLNESDSELMKTFLKLLNDDKMPITQKTCKLIQTKWKQQEITDLVNNLNVVEFDSSFLVERRSSDGADNSASEINRTFLKYCRDNEIDKAEELLNENPDLMRNGRSMDNFLLGLKRTNNEEKLIEYVNRYVENASSTDQLLQPGLVGIAELFQRGYVKECCKLLGTPQYFRGCDRILLTKIIAPVLDKASWDELSMVVSLRDKRHRRLFRTEDLLRICLERKLYEKLLGFYKTSLFKTMGNSKINCDIITGMINDGRVDLIRQFVEILEEHLYMNNSLAVDIVFAYASIGDLKRGRQCLDREFLHTSRIISGLNDIKIPQKRVEIMENIIKILKGENRIPKLYVYEYLISEYMSMRSKPEKGLTLWEELQEENVTPSPEFLRCLAQILKSNNLPVPFEVSVITGNEFHNTKDEKFAKNLMARYFRNKRTFRVTLMRLFESGFLTSSVIKDMIKLFYELQVNDMDLLKTLEQASRWAQRNEISKNISKPAGTKKGNKMNVDGVESNPHIFLLNTLLHRPLSFPVSSTAVKVILWAHFKTESKDRTLAEYYHSEIKNVIKEEKELLNVLKLAPYLKNKQKILEFLISNDVFVINDELEKSARDILNSEFAELKKYDGEDLASTSSLLDEDPTNTMLEYSQAKKTSKDPKIPKEEPETMHNKSTSEFDKTTKSDAVDFPSGEAGTSSRL